MRADPRTIETLRQALAHLKLGQPVAARALLIPIARAAPHIAEAHRLLAFAHLGLNEIAPAEMAFIAAARADPADPSLPASLAELVFNQRRHAEAEAAWRAALAIDAAHAPAAIGLARLLNAAGRPKEALDATDAAFIAGANDPRLLDARAVALAKLGRHAEALELRRRIAATGPSSAIAEQNLAAAHLDLGHHAEAAGSADRAIARGGDAPELHYLRARALQGMNRFDAAEDAYRAALSRRPGYAEAARDLAQLVWMRTADIDRALRPLDDAIAAAGDDPAPALFRARLREFAGDPAGAYRDLAALAARHPGDADIHISAGQAAIGIDPERALHHLGRAQSLAGPGQRLGTTLAAAHLAAGDAARAAALLEPLCKASPHDQSLIAFLATAWRMLGDDRYRALYDYDRLVGCWDLDAPAGWPDLPRYIADLADELNALHLLSTHPVGQSLRHGTMAENNLMACASPAIRAFPQAIDGPVRRHLARLGSGPDVLRRRADGAYRMAGIWTVRLKPGGFHVDHVHPMGWLSSACYVEVPRAVERDREGWLQFGQPGIACTPPLPAEHFVRPAPGRLVLFPSYMWHGTVPFTDESQRLTIAFDLLPGGSAAA